MFPRAMRIATVGGIDVRVDPTWLIIALLVVLSFWGQFTRVYQHPAAAAAVAAVVASFLFFASVLAHELAHALEAKHRGVAVAGITLFLFGGVTETQFEARRPGDEFALSAVGPYASFVAAALFGLVATAAARVELGAVADVAGSLGWLNVLLGAFNLLPGAPLDGGRVLRSAIWKLTGDRERAVRWAAHAGQVLGGGLLALGAYELLTTDDLAFAVWTGFIGWFLYRAASLEVAQAGRSRLLQGRTVRSVLEPADRFLPSEARVSDVLDTVTRSRVEAFPVEERDEVVGVVRLDDLARARRQRPHAPLFTVMQPLDEVPTLDVNADVSEALDKVQRDGVIAVVDADGFVGVLSRQDLEAVLRRLHRFDHDRRRPPIPNQPGRPS